jgi:hypothetical protein
MNPNLRALLLAACLATLASALLDAAPAAAGLYRTLPGLALAVTALSFGHALELFAGSFALVACVALSLRWSAADGQRRALARLLPWLGALLAIGGARQHLVAYAAFAGHLPTNLGLLGVFVATGIACSGTLGRGEPATTRLEHALALAVPGLALLGAAAAQLFTARLHIDEYPTLRLTLVQLAHLLAVIGLWHAARRLPAQTLERVARPWAAAVLVALALALRVTPLLDFVDKGRPLFLARTTLGSSLAALQPYAVEDEQPQHEARDDPDGVARFLRHAQLPGLPADFDVTRYNVLWLMSEATRFDQTSLGSKKDPRLTPNLLELRASGAFSWKRAFAPSSGTFLSLSSLFGLGYPSLLELETWQKPWTGELLDTSVTAAKLFANAGHHTFWVSHNNASCFKKTVLGVQAGFQERTLVKTSKTTDRSIADAAIASLGTRALDPQPFFGFVFFVSPHSPYTPRYLDMPGRRPIEVYRQELRFMDEQLGRVLDALDDFGLSERTIVVFAGDHGEEFQDHGGAFHRATVYSESLRVPLLIRIPGLTGITIKEPTSVGYVLPWLLLHGSTEMKAAAEQRMRTQFGPMLEQTGGAVVSEVLGHDRMKSTLIYPDLKLNYDFRAQRTEVYRFDRDPHERTDLFLNDPALAVEALERLAGYREVRAARRRFKLRPDKLDPRRPKAK